jgi:hypothetical protein
MMDDVLRGACHCGAIRMTLRFTKPAADLQLRSCQCGFCTRQGSITVSDPAGEALISAVPGCLTEYRFATQSGTSLICARCGVYAGAVMEADGGLWSIANVRGLAIPGFEGRAGEAMVYDAESAAERVARRKARWTPTRMDAW